MADWISMTWPGTVRMVSSIAFWHLRVFLHLFAATPAVLFHGRDTGEGVMMRDTLNDKNCISSTEGASTFWGGDGPCPPWWHPCHFISHCLCFDRSASLCSFVFESLYDVFLFCFYFLLFCFNIYIFLSLHPDRITHKTL